MMRWYFCHYPARPEYAQITLGKDGDDLVHSYTSYIWANSVRHARTLARRRNLGEVVDGVWGTKRSKPYPLTSEMLGRHRIREHDHIHILHSATFLSYLLMQSHSAPACDIVGDEGLLHQVIHSIAFGSPRRKDMAATLKYFERRIPGYVAKEGR